MMIKSFYILIPPPTHTHTLECVFKGYQLSRAVRNRLNCTCSPTSSLHQDTSYCCRCVISFGRTRDHIVKVRVVVDASGVTVPLLFKSFLFLWRTSPLRRHAFDNWRTWQTHHMLHTYTYVYIHNSVDYSEQ